MVRPVLYPPGVWVILALLAVLNGIAREWVLVPRFTTQQAHIVSTAVLVAIILLVSASFFATTTIEYRATELVGIGVGWMALTVGFEFLVGFLEGTPPAETIAQYNILAGQVWIIVPITLLLAPIVFGTTIGR